MFRLYLLAIWAKLYKIATCILRACLHEVGGTQVGEVTRLSIKSLILIWSPLHDRWGDQPHVTSPISV